MSTFLFSQIIFGPVKSRRLGVSLGVNLLPNDCKVCNFNCIYCECGWTPNTPPDFNRFHNKDDIRNALRKKLEQMKKNNEVLDVITFAGNGEPTLHPDFPDIINDTINARNEIYPEAGIAVLSNATTIHSEKIFNILKLVEYNILKLDSVYEKTIRLLNNPTGHYDLQRTIQKLKSYNGNFILQTMFVRGNYNGVEIDNTKKEEVDAWINMVNEVNPKMVMIYTIARDTPLHSLEKIPLNVLNMIASKIRAYGFNVQVSG